MDGPRTLPWLLAAQAVLIALLLVVPIGFDHPSAPGLDFGHLLLGLALYGALAVAGVAVGARRQRWGLVALQVATPCALVALALSGVFGV